MNNNFLRINKAIEINKIQADIETHRRVLYRYWSRTLSYKIDFEWYFQNDKQTRAFYDLVLGVCAEIQRREPNQWIEIDQWKTG